MCDFLACPSDLVVLSWLFGILIFVVFFVFLRTKNAHLSLLIFSIFSNILILIPFLSRSLIFRIYHIEWLQYFSVFIWPILNIFLIIRYVRTKKR